MTTLHALLTRAVSYGASDLLLQTGLAPALRVDGALVPLEEPPSKELDDLIRELAPGHAQERFDTGGDCTFAVEPDGDSPRARAHAYKQSGGLGIDLRVVPRLLGTVEELGLPAQLTERLTLQRGLIIVGGRAGSGRSTTAATLLEAINANQMRRIVTIEDPIEFRFEAKQARIAQREVGRDTRSAADAIASHRDADVLYVGELTADTVSPSLEAAHSGTLVIAEALGADVPELMTALTELVSAGDSYRSPNKSRFSALLSDSIAAVIVQTFVATQSGRELVFDVLFDTPAVRALVRDEKAYQLGAIQQTGLKHGMAYRDTALAELVVSGDVAVEDALAVAAYRDGFRDRCARLEPNKESRE
jgi:twitching motility protein PilT